MLNKWIYPYSPKETKKKLKDFLNIIVNYIINIDCEIAIYSNILKMCLDKNYQTRTSASELLKYILTEIGQYKREISDVIPQKKVLNEELSSNDDWLILSDNHEQWTLIS